MRLAFPLFTPASVMRLWGVRQAAWVRILYYLRHFFCYIHVKDASERVRVHCIRCGLHVNDKTGSWHTKCRCNQCYHALKKITYKKFLWKRFEFLEETGLLLTCAALRVMKHKLSETHQSSSSLASSWLNSMQHSTGIPQRFSAGSRRDTREGERQRHERKRGALLFCCLPTTLRNASRREFANAFAGDKVAL